MPGSGGGEESEGKVLIAMTEGEDNDVGKIRDGEAEEEVEDLLDPRED